MGNVASGYSNMAMPVLSHTENMRVESQNGTVKSIKNVKSGPEKVCAVHDQEENLNTKYDLPLRIKQRVNYKSKLSTCTTLRHWDTTVGHL